MIAKKFIDNLDDDVIEAICYSNTGDINSVDSWAIRQNYPLVTLALIAELLVGQLN